jgi:hypothetical protein
LNVKNRVRHVTLGENDLILAKLNNGFPLAYSGEKFLGIKSLTGVVWHVRHGPRGGPYLIDFSARKRPKKASATGPFPAMRSEAAHIGKRGYLVAGRTSAFR